MELEGARKHNSPYNSAHEAYAVILEELEEFWDEVRLKKHLRDKGNMLRELVQIATTAERAAYDLGLLEDEHAGEVSR